MKEINKIPAFKRMCITVGNLPSAFMESMTYYEALQWFVNFLENTVIPAINAEGEAIEEMQTAFITLKNYVDTYFDNLDLQEEVNTKLDDMADKGQLTEIIAQYLGLAGVFGYDTVEDLEAAENITAGSIARVLGKEEYNDGKGCYYKIRTILNTDVIDGDNIIAITYDNTLVGEKIPDYEISVLKKKTDYITPEMFGAIGDGVTDDSEALQDMIDYIEDTIPTEPSDYGNLDWSHISVLFTKKYAIGAPLTVTNSYGAVFNNLNLIATDSFDGDYLIGFVGGTRDLTLNECILNGNLTANKCIFIDDYSLVIRITNCHITRFKEHGLYANNDQGHELLVTSNKINQVEWAERENLETLVSSGIGVFLGTNRHDNFFSNNVINYCRDYSMVINSGATFFNNMHFYWTGVQLNSPYNFISNCYFDGTQLETVGLNDIDNCYFGSDDGDAFIKIIELYSNKWRCDYMRITNNTFQNKGASESILKSIEFDVSWNDHESDFRAEMIGNTFYDCPTVLTRAPAVYAPEQWKQNIWTGTNQYGSDGSCRIGDLLIQYGNISTGGYVNFPIEFSLAPFIVAIDNHGGSSAKPMANDISTKRFYANGVDVTSTWFAIGRMTLN